MEKLKEHIDCKEMTYHKTLWLKDMETKKTPQDQQQHNRNKRHNGGGMDIKDN